MKVQVTRKAVVVVLIAGVALFALAQAKKWMGMRLLENKAEEENGDEAKDSLGWF